MSCLCQSINTFKSFLVKHYLKQSLHRRFPCLFTSVAKVTVTKVKLKDRYKYHNWIKI